ncbi:hypothetical protein [Muricoccus nepalensis]|uniref:hypothetical protein n=1 Tax=Muricoccus nepalensis TaxID=1854500 RepID=UPI00112C0D31|nr:hypothetical protein [Roseomonas nepalensis]
MPPATEPATPEDAAPALAARSRARWYAAGMPSLAQAGAEAMATMTVRAVAASAAALTAAAMATNAAAAATMRPAAPPAPDEGDASPGREKEGDD